MIFRFLIFFAVFIVDSSNESENAVAQVMSFYDIAHTWDGDWDDDKMTRDPVGC